MSNARPAADPIALAEARIRWLDRRQAVLAQNIANADTPNFVARDIEPFAAALARSGIVPERTNARHLGPLRSAAAGRADRNSERSPNGNAVSLDQQALLVAETDQAHALAMTLHHRLMGLFRTALGRQG